MRSKALAVLFLLTAAPVLAADRKESFPRFGEVTVFTSSAPSRVAILVSGEKDWPSEDEAAEALSAANGAVILVDGPRYLAELEKSRDKCAYPAADFEALSQSMQKRLGLGEYRQPVLVGHGAAAGLVYATLAQAPPNTFAGAISLGFCPTMPTTLDFCRGSGLETKRAAPREVRFEPAKSLEAPWVVFEGLADQVCPETMVESFTKQVFRSDIVLIHNVGHDFENPAAWMPMLTQTFARLADGEDPTPDSEDASTRGLPLIEIPAKGTQKDLFAVMISGDGGWAGLDRSVAKSLSEQGVPIVGWNALKYFWKRRTPDEAGADLERLIRHYLTAWNKSSVLLIGYSRGADVMPFMAGRLPPDVARKVALVTLMGPEKTIDFEIHPGDVFNIKGYKNELAVKPEVEKMKANGLSIVCLCGEKEDESLCRELDPSQIEILVLPGGHHFGGDYKRIANEILQRTRK